MTATPASSNASTRYRCRVCKVHRRGAPNLEACPDCGGELRALDGAEHGGSELTTTEAARRMFGLGGGRRG